MPCVIPLLILGAVFSSSWAARVPRPTCEEFSRNATFPSSQAVGVWYLIYLQPSNDPGDAHCVQFATVTDQERNDLKSSISKQVKDMKWENLVLKMQIPCAAEAHNTRVMDYFLEKMDVDGKYKTLEMPANSKLAPTDFTRHEMRLKIVDGKYLVMMDCVEDFTFLLDKQPQKKTIEPALMKLLQTYSPDEMK